MPQKWCNLVDPVSSMHSMAAKLHEMYYITKSIKAFQSDLFWWHAFLQSWNGLSILRNPSILSHPDFCVPTDAFRTWGCAAVLGSRWQQWQWPSEWYEIGITANEHMPIIFTCIVWGPHLSKHNINFQCDNATFSLPLIRDKFVMHLVCSLSFFVVYFDICITAFHLNNVINVITDHLSLGNTCQVFEVISSLTQHPAIISSSAFRLISHHTHDWISPGYLQLFHITLSCIY